MAEHYCPYCQKKRIYWGEHFHYEGCPDVLHLSRGRTVFEEVRLTQRARELWQIGYGFGLGDKPLQSESPDDYSASYLLGYQVAQKEKCLSPEQRTTLS